MQDVTESGCHTSSEQQEQSDEGRKRILPVSYAVKCVVVITTLCWNLCSDVRNELGHSNTTDRPHFLCLRGFGFSSEL